MSLFWRWVVASVVGSLGGVVLGLPIDLVHGKVANLQPVLVSAQIMIAAIAAAIAMSWALRPSFPGLSRMLFIALAVLPWILFAGAVALAGSEIGTSPPVAVEGNTVPDASTEVLDSSPVYWVLLACGAIIVFGLLALAQAAILWIALGRVATGSGSWLLWNGVAGMAMGPAFVALFVLLPAWYADDRTSIASILSTTFVSLVLSLINGLISGIGVARLRPKDLPAP